MLVDHQTHPTSDSTGGTNSRGAAPIAKATTKLSTKTAGGIANPTVRAADVNTAAKSDGAGNTATGMGPEQKPSAFKTARLVARKQWRRKQYQDAQAVSREVHRIHNLIHYDHNSENEFDCQELHELALMRAQLVQLALLTSLQQEVKLEDVRSPAERAADLSAFGPHDMANGPASLQSELEKDEYSLNGTFELGTFQMKTAPDTSWFSREFMEAHPRWLFAYGDCAPEDGNPNPIAKDSTHFAKGTPLAK